MKNAPPALTSTWFPGLFPAHPLTLVEKSPGNQIALIIISLVPVTKRTKQSEEDACENITYFIKEKVWKRKGSNIKKIPSSGNFYVYSHALRGLVYSNRDLKRLFYILPNKLNHLTTTPANSLYMLWFNFILGSNFISFVLVMVI